MKKFYLAIPAGLLCAASVFAGNTTAVASSPAAAAAQMSLENSTVYLRSMLHGDYLTGAGARDLQAMLDGTGYGFTLEATGAPGAYRLRALATGGCLGSDLTFGSSETVWTLESVNASENIFTIADDSSMVLTAVANTATGAYYNPAHTVALAECRPGDISQQWEIIAGSVRTARAKAEGHKGRWIDMTYLIPAFNFPHGSAQTGSWQQITSSWPVASHANAEYVADAKGGLFRYNNEEFKPSLFRSSEFTLQTELTGLPDGLYRFRCQVYNNNLNTNETNLRVWAGDASAEPSSVSNDIHTAAMAGEAFSRGEGWVEVGPVKVSDGRLTIKFEKNHTTSATAFCVDNLRLLYQPAEDPAELTVTLDFPMHYNTMILPFPLTDEKVEQLAADGLHLFRAIGFENKTQNTEAEGSIDYHLIELSHEPCNSVEANIPYVVVNANVEELKGRPLEGEGSALPTPAPAKAPAAGTRYEYTFSGKPVNTTYYYVDALDKKHTLTGALVATDIFPGHYNLDATDHLQGFLQNSSASTRHIEPYRAYVNSVTTPDATLPLFLFTDDFNILTGVEDVLGDAADTITADTPVDVYTAGGIHLRSGVRKAEALSGLPEGIYILSNGTTSIKIAK